MTAWLLAYLLNALWQVPFVFAVAWLAARLLRPASPLAEYRVWLTAAVLQVILPACSGNPRTWLEALHLRRAGAGGSSAVSVHLGPATLHAGLHLPRILAFLLLGVYALTVLYAVLRFVRGVLSTLHLRCEAQPVMLTAESKAVWQRCRRHFHLASISLGESEDLRSPITLGLRKPLILFPAGLLPTLAPADLHTILFHEAAHIARHDFAMNTALQVLSLPIAFHPLTRILLGRLVEAREIVCDALAAEATPTPDGRSTYARSLLRLASTLVQGPPAAAPHAIGIFDAHTLERRIMSLTHSTPRPALLRRVSLVAAAFALCSVTCTSAIALRTAVASPTPVQASDPVRVGARVMAGQVRGRVMPKYPQAAKDAHIQGAVILHAIIGKDGVIDNLTVISGPPELQTSALDAVRQWTYEPYLFNGEPTEVDTTITVNYTLAN